MLNYDSQVEQKAENLKVYQGNEILKSNNPFPGLRSFSIDESHLFFGRERQIDDILFKLIENRFVAVLGASGTGKSSLIHCGIKPILFGGFMAEYGSNWNVISTRPSDSPIDNLAEEFLINNANYNKYSPEEKLVNKTVINSILRSGPDGLIELCKQYIRDTGNNLLIYIDQFEELFRSSGQELIDVEDETAIYICLIMEAVKQTSEPIYIALSMRSDFIGNCAHYQGLTQIVNSSNYLVPQMDRNQMRTAIEGPIAVGGGIISQRLIKRVLSDIGDNQDQLPILQHALMRTWSYWVENKEEQEPIDIRHYNAVGQLSHALSQHADEAYDELSLKEKEVASVLFKSITVRDSNSIAIRRPMTLSQIANIAGITESELSAVIEKFRSQGRSILLPAGNIPLNSNSVIEVSHESLMRIWERLKNWVDEEFESAEMYKRLSEAATMYQVGKTGLWRPPDLQLALNWQNKQKPTREWGQLYDEAFERTIVFLDTSRITYEAEQKNQEMLQKRLLRRAKAVAIILGIAAVISILFLVYAFIQKQEADNHANEALIQKDNAVKQELLANEQSKIARQETQKAKAANDSLKAIQIRLQEALIQAEISRDKAIEQEKIAEQQTLLANNQKDRAASQTIIAQQNYQKAIENKELADNLYMQQLAQSVAVKSLQVESPTLKGLLAQQAYLFNKESGGRKYDPYIYEALYFAKATLDGKEFNTVKSHRNAVRSVIIDNSGTHFYSTGSDGKILRHNISEKQTLERIGQNGHANRVMDLSPDNKWLAIGSDSSAVELFNLNSDGSAISRKDIVKHNSFVYDLKFTKDNKGLYSLSNDRNLIYYDFKNSKTIKYLSSIYKCFDISPDQKSIVLGSIDGKVTLLDLNNNSEQEIMSIDNTPIHDVIFSNNGRMIAIGDEKGHLYLWDIQRKQIVEELTGHKARINGLAFTNDDQLLASASYDGTIQIWVMDKLGDLPIILRDNDSYIWDIQFTNDSQFLIAGGNNGETRIWPTDATKIAEQICHKLKRNMSQKEWRRYIGNSVGFRNTCKSILFRNKETK